ncbi:MAG: hypothetical protein BWY78_00931 [Alphaproteobacteria bacterium ADurb.Bin438]|nr:MAG: hypothetical protein BWY78_00931 [Alphaproteobacteria bacterium ADurb.Bin438]
MIPLFDKYFDGGYKEFKKSLKNYRKEFEENAPPEMIADNANELDRLIKELGKLDVSKIKEKEEDLYSIGRPKSEFDAIDENDQSLPQAPKPPPVSTIKEINSKKDEED